MGFLKSCPDRHARFRTVICLMLNGEQHFFEGICNGTIATEQTGSGGFGYDPVFIPEGATQTFAQMDIAEKGRYSHRSKALAKLVEFLNSKSHKFQI